MGMGQNIYTPHRNSMVFQAQVTNSWRLSLLLKLGPTRLECNPTKTWDVSWIIIDPQMLYLPNANLFCCPWSIIVDNWQKFPRIWLSSRSRRSWPVDHWFPVEIWGPQIHADQILHLKVILLKNGKVIEDEPNCYQVTATIWFWSTTWLYCRLKAGDLDVAGRSVSWQSQLW